MSVVRPAMLSPKEHAVVREVSRGQGDITPLTHGDSHNIESITFSSDNTVMSVGDFLTELDNDSLLVLLDGQIVHENYRFGNQQTVHQLASMSKSVVGIVAAMMIANGEIDSTRTVASYVHEFAGCAYGETIISHLLDMRTKIMYENRPYDQLAEASRFFAVVGLIPKDESLTYPSDIREWMKTSQHEVEPGTTWRYENGNTEAVAEVMMAVSGLNMSELISERLWKHIGAESHAEWAVDASGREMASGGLSMTLRDVARVGELLRRGGVIGGNSLVDTKIVDEIRMGAHREVNDALAVSDFGPALPGYGYHDFWWLPPMTDSLLASGRFGQHLFVSPVHGVTIAMQSSAAFLGFKMYGRRLTAMLEAICKELAQ